MADFVEEIIANPETISALARRATAFLAGSGVDERAAHHVVLVLDEVLTNLAEHAAAPDISASVQLVVLADRISGAVVDGGALFDPRTPRDVDVSPDIGKRSVGGLGLMLVHRLTGGLDYERVGDRNRTTFWIHRTPAI